MNDKIRFKICTSARRGDARCSAAIVWDGSVKELGAPLFSPLQWRVVHFVFPVFGRVSDDAASPTSLNTWPAFNHFRYNAVLEG